MTEYVRAAVTMLAVINPVVCGVMLLQIEGDQPKKEIIFAAAKSSLAVLFILILSALIGKYILNAFGISMDVFQIVGGVIIAYIGFGMFSPSAKPADSNQTDKQTLSTLIMFAASPGTIATVIALSAVHDKVGMPMNAMVGVILAVLVTWIIMLVMVLASGSVKKGGQQIVTRLMGLILISMGLQFVLTGLKSFMAD